MVGLDVATGEPIDPMLAGIFDNYLVKKQILQGAPIVASQLLLVDEVMRAGATTYLLRTCTEFASIVHSNYSFVASMRQSQAMSNLSSVSGQMIRKVCALKSAACVTVFFGQL